MGNITKPVSALRIFLWIAKAWRLTEEQQCTFLGIPDLKGLTAVKRNPAVGTEEEVTQRMRRIYLVYSIFGSLDFLLPDSDAALAWIRQPNKELACLAPLDCMLETPDGLARVQRHLKDRQQKISEGFF